MSIDPFTKEINKIKKQLFKGIVEKLLLIPWIPCIFSFFSMLFLIQITQLTVKGFLYPNQVVTNRMRLTEFSIAFIISLIIASIVKIRAKYKIRKKLKKKGLL